MHQSSIAQIKEKLNTARSLTDQERREMARDPRIGVRRLLELWEKKQRRIGEMVDKFHEMNHFEDMLHAKGMKQIAGIDEAGRGPLAGPVVAACVILRPGAVLPGINDSKQLTPSRRVIFYDQIKENALSIGVGIVSAHEIDQINIYQAARKAMTEAVDHMRIRPDYLLIDAMHLPLDIAQTSLVKGDARSNSIAAASIMAKVTRDRLMDELDHLYPGYGFAAHKGYGTKAHLQAIRRLGPCLEHRMSFAPLKS